MVTGGASSSTGKRLSALIVDDDSVVRKIHRMLLSKCGLEVQTVENGLMAVDLFQSGSSFDIVLMDNEMPVMDGIQATRILREMKVNTVIVGITSRNLESEKHEFMIAGLDVCLVKPLNVEKLKGILQNIANKK